MRILKSSVRLLTTATLLVTLLGLVSCSKDIDEEESTSETTCEVDEDFEVQDCYNHSLIHFAAVEPTANEGGNIEYWYCENCCKYYSDADGANEIVTPFLRSHNRAMGDKLLAKYPMVFAWSDTYGYSDPSEPQTKVAIAGVTAALNAVKAGVGVVSGIFSAANSIKKLLSSEDEQKKLDQIMEGIDEIKTEVGEVKVNTNEILNLLEDAPYKEQIGKKVTMLTHLWDEATMALKTMNEYVDDFEAGKITEDYANEQIIKTVKDWGEERSISDGSVSHEMLPAIEELLQDFSSLSLGGGRPETFPEIARKHVQSYVAFDNQGYGHRAGLMRFYQFSLAPAYYLYKLYRFNVDEMKDDNPKYWQEIYDKNEQKFKNIDDLIKKDSTNMNLAYEHYRVFRPNLSARNEVTYFNAKVSGPYNFAKWIDNHFWSNGQAYAWFPGDNTYDKFETYSNKMWSETTGITGDHEYLMNKSGQIPIASHNDYLAILSEFPDSSLYNVLKYEGQFVGSHLYGETVKMDGGTYTFHYFHWWPRDTQIKFGKSSHRTIFVGETGYTIKNFDNRWMCFKIVCDKVESKTDYVNFGMESSRKENGECENIVFYENVPVDADLYDKYDFQEKENFGYVKSPSDNTKNTKHCFGILEHYDSTNNPIYE